MRALSSAGISVSIVRDAGSADYVGAFTVSPASVPWYRVGQTPPKGTNFGAVFTDNTASSWRGSGYSTNLGTYGTSLGSVLAHEFGHYAGNLPDEVSGVMSWYKPEDFANGARRDFMPEDIPQVQSICSNKTRQNALGGGASGHGSGQGGSSSGGGVFIWGPGVKSCDQEPCGPGAHWNSSKCTCVPDIPE